MRDFTRKHGDLVLGTLSGFDRLVFRGGLRVISYVTGMMQYLSTVRVLLKDFGSHVQGLSDQVKEATEAMVRGRGQKVIYLASPKLNKEEIARAAASRDRVTSGPICVLSSVEPCRSFEIRRDKASRRLSLEARWRKCLFYYHYWMDPVFGFMSARLQTWVPFPVQICINGREWLCRHLDATGQDYVRRDNCLVWTEDVAYAQQALREQLRTRWPAELDGITQRLNPVHDAIFEKFPIHYYWTAYQTEWATDVMFRCPDALARLYPRLLHHGITSFASPDVMRFLGARCPTHGHVNGNFKGQVVTSLKHRPEGVRIKHYMDGNSIKMYNKQGSVLRVETTLHNPRRLKVYRRAEGSTQGPLSWRPLRKSIADLHRRAQLSQTANERYLQALAKADTDTTFGECIGPVCKPVIQGKTRFRALRPADSEELRMLALLDHGEFLISGFRNKDLVAQLHPKLALSTPEHARARKAMAYRLRILRAHGIVNKIQGTQRYQVSASGRQIITAALAAQRATIAQLAGTAA